MADSLYFVQFPHPGGEPRSADDDWVRWNSSDTHARKCLQSPGRWRTSANLDADEHEGAVVFWGEWEPPSRVQVTDLKNEGWPRYIHVPFWHEVPDEGHFHNTDPYVFGNCFRYSTCRQNTKNGPRATQRLASGSLVVFGSSANGDFVVDTVFVVARAQPISSENLVKLRGVDEVFRAVVLDLLYRVRSAQFRYRLYEGATPDAPVRGMFSFFPCLPFSKAPNGFPRPAIRLDELINPECKRNFKLGKPGSLKEVEKLWRRIVDQVLDAGLYLGVHAATPTRVPRDYRPPAVTDVGDACGPGAPSKTTSGCGKEIKC